jgi:hypothetical protein
MSPHPLDYGRPPAKKRSEVVPALITGMGIGAIIGVALTALTALLSFGAGGYEFASVVFPWPMAAARLGGDGIYVIAMVLALMQYPTYMGALAWSATRGVKPLVLTFSAILLVHLAGIASCFLLARFI